MCSFGKAPAPVAVPEVQAPPPAVQEGDAAVANAKQSERQRRLRASQSQNTLVTGGQGVLGSTNVGAGQALGV